MKKIILISAVVFILLLLIFLWLVNRKNNPPTTSTSSNFTQQEGVFHFPFGGKTTSPLPLFISPTTTTLNTSETALLLKLQSFSPFSSTDFDFVYSPDLKKYLITKKTTNADASILKWAQQNGLLELFSSVNGKNPFTAFYLVRDISSINQTSSGSVSTGAGTGSGSKSPPGSGSGSNQSPRTGTSSSNTSSSSSSNSPNSSSSSNTISFTNQAMTLVPPTQQKELSSIKSKPVDTKSFSVTYSNEFDTYIVEMKNSNAEKEIQQWAKHNNLQSIINDPNIFAFSSKPADQFEVRIDENILNSIKPPTLLDVVNKTLSSVFSGAPDDLKNADIEKMYGLKSRSNSSNTTLTTENNNISTNISSDILQLIASYNLPPPTLEGYTAQLQKLQSDPRAIWAAKAVLNGEKLYKQKGGDINMYLTTAWIWLESGGYWPDIYEINCNGNNEMDSSGKTIHHEFTDPDSLDQVSMFCKYSNFQLAGYQAADHAGEYQKIFKLLYGDSAEVKPIMQKVIDNSTNALFVQESYLEAGQQKGLVTKYLINSSLPSDITINNISPGNGGFLDEKTQFYTLILGKDPNMVAALNASAVKELPGLFNYIAQGQNDKAGWANYLKKDNLQSISNMIAALYLLDTGGTSLASSGNNKSPPTNPGTISGNCKSAGPIIVVPGARQQHLDWTGDCIKPTMIVIHWSGSWGPTQVTFDTLNLRGLGCQLETDNNELVQTLDMFTTRVERSACVANYNNTTISNELSGLNFDNVYLDTQNNNYQKLLAITNRALQATCWQMKQYNISVDQVYGHLELNPPPEKYDPGINYINYFRDRLSKECK